MNLKGKFYWTVKRPTLTYEYRMLCSQDQARTEDPGGRNGHDIVNGVEVTKKDCD